jgi:hypothetical protein
MPIGGAANRIFCACGHKGKEHGPFGCLARNKKKSGIFTYCACDLFRERDDAWKTLIKAIGLTRSRSF